MTFIEAIQHMKQGSLAKPTGFADNLYYYIPKDSNFIYMTNIKSSNIGNIMSMEVPIIEADWELLN